MTDKQAMHAALSLLTRREHSYRELYNKLIQKGFVEADVDSVLAHLTAQRYVCDTRFCEQRVRYRANQGHGPVKIMHELLHLGISEEQARQAIYDGSYDWQTK